MIGASKVSKKSGATDVLRTQRGSSEARGTDAGARLDVRDNLLKSTPLGWACRWGRVELVELLLDRGADPIEAEAESWATPRAWAEKMQQPAVLALIQDRA